MQEFTIRDIENLTGIKAHTLRIWELRYNMFKTKRKQSLHRIYDNEDLKQMLRVSFLYHQGWKISKIAALNPQTIEEHVRNSVPGKPSGELYINRLLEKAVDFDEYGFISLLNEVMEQLGFEKGITQVCYPYLIKLGHLWSTNNVIPAQEHFSSYIIQNRIIAETEKLTLPGKSPEIILFSPKGEKHELPLLFVNYLMKKHGWGTLYMGVSVRLEELEKFAQLPGINTIYMHLITNLSGFTLDDLMERICVKFPGKSIIGAGRGFHLLQRKFTNLQLLLNDDAILGFIKNKNHLGST